MKNVDLFRYSDGGSPAHEKNDCTVTALAITTGCDYALAHAHLEKHGRKPGRIAMRCVTDSAYEQSILGGCILRKVYQTKGRRDSRTLKTWLTSGELPERCIMRVRRHVLAVIDGTVVDSEKPRVRMLVKTVWKVEKV